MLRKKKTMIMLTIMGDVSNYGDNGGSDDVTAKTPVLIYTSELCQALQTHYVMESL